MSPRSKADNEKIRAQSRTQILMTALQAFGEKGYANTSISYIAKQAGVSKGLIYHYFESKEEILEGIFYLMMEEGDKVTNNWDGKSVKEKLRGAIQASILFMRTQTELMSLLISLISQPSVIENIQALMKKEREKLVGQYVTIFEELGYEDPETEAFFLGALLDGSGLGYISMREDYPLGKLEQKILKHYNL